ncbi:MAG: molybdopterin-dependent oxidoreductase [Deltaproteobacteria bacterium]|nr:molybdopterin-dependent oxidoreductase [Deltaproteobacteria bacterium]
MTNTSEKKIITTCTRDCPSACGVIATVVDGKVTSLKGNPNHPVTGGRTCGKLAKYVERVYSPDRVTHPMRKASDGSWTAVSWDDALDEVSFKMDALRKNKGPRSILYYQGFGTRTALELLNRRFFNLLGGATTLKGTLCGGTGEAAQNLDFGKRISHDPTDHRNAKTIILWGRNPAATQQPLMPIVEHVRQSGGEAVVIDPVHTPTAKAVTRHIQPAPGKDLWLALAVAAHILENGWHDKDFLDRHTDNTNDFIQLARRWSTAELTAAAGVSTEDVHYLAHRLAKAKPAAILLGWGLHRWTRAHEAIRVIDALSAMTGNIGIAGGGVSQGFDEWGPYDASVTGDQWHCHKRQLLMPKIGEEILNAKSPNIEMIFVTAGNPLTMAPDSTTVRRAFENTPFVVYCGQFMDDTAAVADLFLPVTTWLEETDIVAAYGHDAVGPVTPAILPVGEAHTHFAIFADLARRLGFTDFEKGEAAWLDDIIAPLHKKGITADTLQTGPVRQGLPHVPYTDKKFPTPSGRLQLICEIESAMPNDPQTEWPFALLTTSPRNALCSEWLPKDQLAMPTVTLGASAAAELHLTDGQEVIVESPVGQLTAHLKIDPRQRNDVALIYRGGWQRHGHGVNVLTESHMSQVGMGTAYYETRVRVRGFVSRDKIDTV